MFKCALKLETLLTISPFWKNQSIYQLKLFGSSFCIYKDQFIFQKFKLFVQICNGYSQMGLEEKPTLFLEFHGSDSGLKEQSSVVAEIADQNGGSNFQWATKMEDRQKLWSARSFEIQILLKDYHSFLSYICTSLLQKFVFLIAAMLHSTKTGFYKHSTLKKLSKNVLKNCFAQKAI